MATDDEDEVIFMGWMSLPFAAMTAYHTEDCIYTSQAKDCDGSCLNMVGAPPELPMPPCTECHWEWGTNPDCPVCTVRGT